MKNHSPKSKREQLDKQKQIVPSQEVWRAHGTIKLCLILAQKFL